MKDLTRIDGIAVEALRQAATNLSDSGTPRPRVPPSKVLRFWASAERYASSPLREVLEVTFSGTRLVNYLTFQVSVFPHVLTAEYLDEQSGQWYPFVAIRETPGIVPRKDIPTEPVSLQITTSQPARVNTARININTHPQHFGSNHWQEQAWRIMPISCTTIRLVLVRSDVPGASPVDTSGVPVAYSLAVKDLQVGYRINTRADIPRYNEIESDDDVTFASSTDLLGSRIVYSLREQKAKAVTDADRETSWRSEPQPVNYAVVNFYADTRSVSDRGQVIDKFKIDPLTIGVACNLYHSNDDPTGDYEALDEAIDYPARQTFGAPEPVPEKFGSERWAHDIFFSNVGPSFIEIQNSFLHFRPNNSWWIGLSAYAVTGSTDFGDHPWLTFGTNMLRQINGTIEFLTENGERASIDLPPEHRVNVEFNLAVVYTPTGNDDFLAGLSLIYQVGDSPSQMVTVEVDEGFTVPDTIRIGAYAGETVGIPALRLRTLIVKNRPTTVEETEWFLADGPRFVRKSPYSATDTFSTLNALLRIHPMFVRASNPQGVVGGAGDTLESLTWTPVAADFRLRRGFLHIAPTRAKYWKFEFTNLLAEHYESFVVIDRHVKVFNLATVQHFAELESATTAPALTPGTQTAISLNSTDAYPSARLYADALDSLVTTSSFNTTRDESEFSPTTAMYLRDAGQAAKIANKGWIWNYQPWHQAAKAPRFIETSKHVYETISVKHKAKVGYFVGLRSLVAYRLDYLSDDDTPEYVDHFHDLASVASLDGFTLGNDNDLVAESNYAVAISKKLPSRRDVRGVQFATMQSDPVELLSDDVFASPDFGASWSSYGDAEVTRRGTNDVVVNRGWVAATYGDLEAGTYGSLNGQYYGVIEGGTAAGTFEGGLASIAVTPSGYGRIYGAIRVSARRTLGEPLVAEIVSTTGAVLASTTRPMFAGETADIIVGYTPGSVTNFHTWGDAQAQGTYGTLEASTYAQLESNAILTDVYARVKQVGTTADTFTVQRMSIFDDAIRWSFSVNNGTTWFPAIDVRNNPHAALIFPVSGKRLKWKVETFVAGAAVSALAIRPWYSGYTRAVQGHRSMSVDGPNISAPDNFTDIETDPMWRRWNNPIPSWWFRGVQVLPWPGVIQVDPTIPDEEPVVVVVPPQQINSLVLGDAFIVPGSLSTMVVLGEGLIAT